MKKHLIRLANRLDNLGLLKEADAIDHLLVKISEQDDFLEFSTDVIPGEAGNVQIASRGDEEIVVNIFSHPLAVMVREFVEVAASLSAVDPKYRKGQVSVRVLDRIVDEFKKYNEDMSASDQHWSINELLVSPGTVDKFVKSIASFIYNQLKFEIDVKVFNESIRNIFDLYRDFYNEDYNRVFSDPKDMAKKTDEWYDKNWHLSRQRERDAEQHALRQRQRELSRQTTEVRPRLSDIDTEIIQDDATKGYGE